MRQIAILLAILLLFNLTRADFRDLSLVVDININANGSAHVVETTTLSLDSSSEELYERSILSRELTIQDWSMLTKSTYIRQHILSAISTQRIRIVPEKLVRYGFNTSTAVIKIDYDIDGVLIMNKTGPRKTLYTFKKSVLSFENSPSGPVLPKYTDLVIRPPKDAIITHIYPEPDEPKNIFNATSSQIKGLSEITWKGTVPVSEFEFVFLMEEPLDVEVNEFFREAQKTVVAFVFSQPGAIIITLIVLAGIFYLLFKKK
jgi:hypothetical protein